MATDMDMDMDLVMDMQGIMVMWSDWIVDGRGEIVGCTACWACFGRGRVVRLVGRILSFGAGRKYGVQSTYMYCIWSL